MKTKQVPTFIAMSALLDMIHNTDLPRMEIDAQTYEVRGAPRRAHRAQAPVWSNTATRFLPRRLAS